MEKVGQPQLKTFQEVERRDLAHQLLGPQQGKIQLEQNQVGIEPNLHLVATDHWVRRFGLWKGMNPYPIVKAIMDETMHPVLKIFYVNHR